jgi:cbb3-type cytochrome oxidase cytochrome c subunit
MSNWQLSCRVCHKIVWRLPQILFVSLLVVASIAGLVYIVEYLARM